MVLPLLAIRSMATASEGLEGAASMTLKFWSVSLPMSFSDRILVSSNSSPPLAEGFRAGMNRAMPLFRASSEEMASWALAGSIQALIVTDMPSP